MHDKLSPILELLDPALLVDVTIEAIPKDRPPIAALRRFSRLERLELSAYRAPLPAGLASLLEGLAPTLRYLSLYSWQGRGRFGHEPQLRPLPANVLPALPALAGLTGLQLGGANLPRPGALTALSCLAHLALHTQHATATLPPLPSRALFPALRACCLDYVDPQYGNQPVYSVCWCWLLPSQ